ncbi:MAG: hypothetical protein RI922_2215 [Bacteroidota bacterium]|jgi:hypothetical protein
MKYRILSNEELSHMEEDFKHFLIVNGVHAEEWEALNKNDVEKAVQLVEVFSDTVLQKVYEKIEYLEFRSVDTCMVFHLRQEKIELISIHRKANSEADLSTVESIHEALKNDADQLNFFKTEKPYSKNREAEIHEMIEQGCVLSNSQFWTALSLSIVQN